MEGRTAREAGEALGMSAGAVYVARSRVLARLKEEVQRLEEADQTVGAGTREERGS